MKPATPCLEWHGARTTRGYGVLVRDGRRVYAHRDAYEKYYGPIPEGLEIDHLCMNPPCYRPDHLEAVTHAENTRRWAATITHCPQGHPYDETNTIRQPSGGRLCRTCKNERRNTGHWTVSKDHCPKGHEYTEENTKWEGGGRWRRCATCSREHRRAYKERRKARADA